MTIVQGWVKGGSSVSLRFRAEETCDFSREVSRGEATTTTTTTHRPPAPSPAAQPHWPCSWPSLIGSIDPADHRPLPAAPITTLPEVEDPSKFQQEVRSRGRLSRTFFSSKVVTTIKEYLWDFNAKWELCAVRGVGEAEGDVLVLSSIECGHTIKTATKSSPRPEAVVPAKMAEVDITWLITQLLDQDDEGAPSPSKVPAFTIDRAASACKTPRRNPEVENALSYFMRFRSWSQDVCR